METTDGKRTLYKIKIQGPLDHFSSVWNGDISILHSEEDETLLACQLLDQAALRGFLNQLWNLNFTILTVERIENMDGEISPFPEKGGKQS
jgi:hypothetical protein